VFVYVSFTHYLHVVLLQGTNEDYFRLCEIGLRAGVEMLDLESARDGPPMQALLARAARLGIQVVGSHHELGPMPSAAGD